MSNVIDFLKERAIRKSGISDISIINDMIENCYDPCNPEDRNDYWNRCKLIDLLNDKIGPVTIEDGADFIYEPDFSLFFDDTPNK